MLACEQDYEQYMYFFLLWDLSRSSANAGLFLTGGGEVPKPISSRILVAAYWIFVVLMLATFTANLSAFLTVERLKSSAQSLEDLAKQSKINYTVVADSPYFDHFASMAMAEEELYR